MAGFLTLATNPPLHEWGELEVLGVGRQIRKMKNEGLFSYQDPTWQEPCS